MEPIIFSLFKRNILDDSMKILFGKISNGCNYIFGRTENDFVMAAVGAFIKTGEYGIYG